MNMEEVWKEVCVIKSNSKAHLKGDTYYFSNKGRVKLNDIIIDFDKGLYVCDKELRVYGCKMPEKTFHRVIYDLFGKDEIIKDYNHNIHHIDGNHINNSIDNLIQVTSKEHALLHKKMYENLAYDRMMLYNEDIAELNSKRHEHIKKAKEFLEQYAAERAEKLKSENKKRKEERERLYKENKERERQEKLDNGYKLDKNGNLYNPESHRYIVLKRSKESYIQQSETLKQKYKTDKTYKEKIRKANKGRVYINDGLNCLMVKKEELNDYLSNGWKLGRFINK